MVYLGALATSGPEKERLKIMRTLLRRTATLAFSTSMIAVCTFSASRPAAALQDAGTQSDKPAVSANTPAVPATTPAQLVIPGPRRSFLRMAGISQKASVE